PPAQAVAIGPIDLNPLNWPGEILGGVTGGIAKVAGGAFDAIIRALFAPVARFITTELIGWLVAVPNLTQGNGADLEQTVEAMGGGLLGAVATFSTIRYWAAGFARRWGLGVRRAGGVDADGRRGPVPRGVAVAVRHGGGPDEPVHQFAAGVRGCRSQR